MSLQQIRRENEVAIKLRKNLEHEMVVLEERKAVSLKMFKSVFFVKKNGLYKSLLIS